MSNFVCMFVSKELLQLVQNIFGCDGSAEKNISLLEWISSPPRFSTVRVNFPHKAEDVALDLQKILIAQYSGRNKAPPIIHIHKQIPDLLVIPSTVSINPIFPVDKEVIVDVHCGAAVLRGADIFAPGVLGAPLNLQVGDIVSVYADITGKCLKGCLKINNEHKLFLGNGKAVMSRKQLFNVDKVSGIAIEMLDLIIASPPLSDSVLGETMFLQNLPSVLCVHVLNPKPTDWVLDMCAAPGGKTTHLSSLMRNSGVIIALDKTRTRVSKLKLVVELSKYSNIHCFVFDSTRAIEDSKPSRDAETIRRKNQITSPPYPVELFDCILLDAPCSALGQRPQLLNKMQMKEFDSFHKLQQKLLSVATLLVKPGGKIVYSTCSFSVQENEEIVSWALQKYPSLELATQDPAIGGAGLKVDGLTVSDCQKLQRFDVNSPGSNEDSDTIGFFIAKFVKKCATSDT